MKRLGTWLTGWFAILGCYYAGVALTHVFALPLPPALIGLLLMLIALIIRGRPATAVSLAAAPLLKHMSVLFVPAVLGVGLYWHDIQQHAWSLFMAIGVSTAMSLGVTAWLAVRILAHSQGDTHHD